MFCKSKANEKIKEHMATAASLAAIFVFSYVSIAAAQSKPSHEYRLKATFIYQFINFVDGWKFEQQTDQEKAEDEKTDEFILIGIVGEDPFGDSFKPLAEKAIKGRKIKVRIFKGFSELNSGDEKVAIHPEIEDIKKCDLLFVCVSEQKYINEILDPIRNLRILTVADTKGFLKKGGIINFIIENNKVRFEINVSGAKRAKMTIRSKLLRLAAEIIMKDDLDKQ
ncbi:MAG: YfiR family protein [Sedimentisphaerales bacterium]|nr:YfiR family protein [Sedimentisphaerales bacterium]